MSLKIQVVSNEKFHPVQGMIAFIMQNEKLMGGAAYLKAQPDFTVARKQFEDRPQNEIAVWSDWAKHSVEGVFYADTQVKHLDRLDTLRVIGARAARHAAKSGHDRLAIALDQAKTEEILAVIQGAQIADYSFKKYKTSAKPEKKLSITVSVGSKTLKSTSAALKESAAVAAGVNFARDLVNEVPAALYPAELARIAKKQCEAAGVKVTVLDEKQLAKGNFNGILTVGKGSNRPPRLIVLKAPAPAKSPVHLCLVGKAVTFDTGGHCLKPGKSMWEMKGDMAGGAAVLGAMKVLGTLRPDIQVTGIVASALNAIGPDAVLPGDIIRSRSGKTVHVDNTDAEGRLLLMDALDYAQEIGATHIVDVATLTGSIVRALGESLAGLFANDDKFSDKLISAGNAVGEGFWRMPLVREYRDQLDHTVADIDNMGKGVNAGAIVAALFLQEFVDDSIKWAHLDIAGCGLYTRSIKYHSPGATGFGVKTLVELARKLPSA